MEDNPRDLIKSHLDSVTANWQNDQIKSLTNPNHVAFSVYL